MSETFPDVEGALRDWLRGRSAIEALVDERVFFGVSGDNAQIVVQRVGGGDDLSEAPLDIALIQLDLWGSKSSPSKADLDELRRTVRAELYQLREATALNDDVTAYGANVASDLWRPDPANDRPRYILTVEVTARSTVAA